MWLNSIVMRFIALSIFMGLFLLSCAIARPGEAGTPITGLPVYLSNVADWPGRPMSDHTAVRQLSEFFTYPINYSCARVNLFAFVKILETEPLTIRTVSDREDGPQLIRQDSTAQVLSAVWSSDVEVPETFTLTQETFSRRGIVEDPSFVRKGGVYLLPLINVRFWGDYLWVVRAPYNVLFEVDDKGRIWSHSPHQSFNRFDGENYSVIVDAILDITSDENFDAATITPFGTWAGWGWTSLVEFTVLSAARVERAWSGWSGNHHYQLMVYINEILTLGSEARVSKGSEVIMRDPRAGTFEEGQRYLMFIDSYSFNVNGRTLAKINEDNTITALPGAYHLDGFYGFTVEQMRETAERARAWYDAHVR